MAHNTKPQLPVSQETLERLEAMRVLQGLEDFEETLRRMLDQAEEVATMPDGGAILEAGDLTAHGAGGQEGASLGPSGE